MPADSVVLSGHFLHAGALSLQLQVARIEEHLAVRQRLRFPQFYQVCCSGSSLPGWGMGPSPASRFEWLPMTFINGLKCLSSLHASYRQTTWSQWHCITMQVLWYTAAEYARRLAKLCPLEEQGVRERASQKSRARQAADATAAAEETARAEALRLASAGRIVEQP